MKTFEFSMTLEDEDHARLVEAYRAVYGQIQDGEDKEKRPVMRDRTDDEVIEAMQAGLVEGILANVHSYEVAEAAKAARDSVVKVALAKA